MAKLKPIISKVDDVKNYIITRVILRKFRKN